MSQMTRLVAVRLTDEQHTNLERAAQFVGLGVSTYMRQLAIVHGLPTATNQPKREASTHE